MKFKAVEVNQACIDEHARCEDGRENCSNNETNEATGEGDEENCEHKTNTAEDVETFLWKLEINF